MMIAMAVLTIPMAVYAQDKVEATVGADFVSHYVWRGQDRGGFSIQPDATVSWKGLYAGMFGNAGFDADDVKEIDLTLGYRRWGFNIGVTDYWQTGIDENDRYFYYDARKGPHQYEGNIGYTCKYFELQAYTIFWGNDYKISGDQAYSTYIELGIPFNLGGAKWDLKAGVTPFESAGTAVETELSTIPNNSVKRVVKYYDYADSFSCISASLRVTKELDLGFSKIPVFAELNANPYMRTAHCIFGFRVQPF